MRGNRILALVTMLVALILSACGSGYPAPAGTSTGGGGGSGSGSGSAAASMILTAVQTAPASSSSPAAFTITAYVVDANNAAVASATVLFAASSGCSCTISSSVVTDATGAAVATLTGTQSGTITVTAEVSGTTVTSSVQVTIAASPVYQLGNLTGSVFTAGVIHVDSTSLTAGASTGLQVTLYDTANSVPYNGSASVSFTSACISAGTATVTSPVTSSSGTFNSTYTAAGCSGPDTITASVVIGNATYTATNTVTVGAATAGSLKFVSASPTTIGLKGTGLNESSIVTFQVLDTTGNGVAGATVNFALTTTVGGMTLNTPSAVSGASGNVTVTVQSGTVHTTVRVLATSGALSTQSSLLTVSTGVPAQNAFSISASTLRIEGDDIDGVTSTITARLSDRYNNPVPDGTAVAFYAEGGQIQPSCTTVGGSCSVVFTSNAPRTETLAAVGTSVYNYNGDATGHAGFCGVHTHALGCDDHRYTITATAIGEESFVDCHGTGLFDSTVSSQCPVGDAFVSLPEAFLDVNEDGSREGAFETFYDYNVNGLYDSASGKFIGLLCNDPKCDTTQSLLNVRSELVIVMASSSSLISLLDSGGNPVQSVSLAADGTSLSNYTVVFTDTAGQAMPTGSTVSVASSIGSVISTASYTPADGSGCPITVTGCSVGGTTFSTELPVTIQAPAGAGHGLFTVTVKSPKGVTTILSFPVTAS